MPELVNSTYISLDGVVEQPETWPATGGFGAAGNQIQTDMILGCSAVLMGRRTYDSFAEVWPTMSGDVLADKMNSMPKYVASRTLKVLGWNNSHVIEGDLVTAVRRLKDEPGGDIVQFGFGEVSYALMAAGLLDRLRLWVHPFFIGRGGSLYREAPTTGFSLVDATTLESGIVLLDYRVNGNESEH